MSETIEKRLSDLGVTHPVAAFSFAIYVPYCRTGNLLFTAGQLQLKDGKLQASGLLGRDVDTASGK
ncbi:RidA family protein, partial [Mesorhizobium sp. M8A.F.Ca.ET.023.02.2.1]